MRRFLRVEIQWLFASASLLISLSTVVAPRSVPSASEKGATSLAPFPSWGVSS